MVQSTDETSRALLEFGMLLRLIPIHALVMNALYDVLQSLENGIFGITRCCPAIPAQNVLCLEPFFNVSDQGVGLTPRVKEIGVVGEKGFGRDLDSVSSIRLLPM